MEIFGSGFSICMWDAKKSHPTNLSFKSTIAHPTLRLLDLVTNDIIACENIKVGRNSVGYSMCATLTTPYFMSTKGFYLLCSV